MMNKFLGSLFLGVILVCGMGAGPCWTKHYANPTVPAIPNYHSYYYTQYVPTTVNVPVVVYQPITVERRVFVQDVVAPVVYNPYIYTVPVYQPVYVYPTRVFNY